MQKKNHPLRTRLTALLLALVCVLGLLPTAAFAAADTITLKEFGHSGVGYESAALGRCTLHEMTFKNGGKDTTGFCGTKGGSMGDSLRNQTWGHKTSISDPTVETMMAYYYAHSTGVFTDEAKALGVDDVWGADYRWYMNAWVQACIWRYQQGSMSDPVVACAEELMAVYNTLKGTHYTSIDQKQGSTSFRDRTQFILDLGDQGAWGKCAVYEYTFTGTGSAYHPAASVQKIILGDLVVEHIEQEEYAIIIKKVDATNPSKGLPGAGFHIESQNGSYSKDIITGENGVYRISGLSAGTYAVTETAPPPGGYEIDSVAPQYVVLPSNNNKTVTITFRDSTTITGEGSIRKVDSDNPSNGLAGAVIKITGVDNSFVGTYTTGAGGYLTDVPWDTMPIGSFIAEEVTPPEGFSLSPDASKVKQSFVWDGKHDVSLVFENDSKVKIQLIKLDDSNNPLPGCVFNILKDGQLIGSEATKEDGSITVSNVTEGLFAFVEVSAPSPFATLTEPVIAHVDQATINGGGTVTVSAADKKLPNLTILKRDKQTGEVIPETHFEIRGIHFGYHNDVVTGPDGKAVLSSIPVDSYEVTEKSVKDPYVVGDNPTQTIWLEAGDSKELVFDNLKQPLLKIAKVEKGTNPLVYVPNTNFLIEGIDSDYRNDVTTGKDGTVELRLAPGSYKITERSVPEPYCLPEDEEDRVQVVSLNPGDEKMIQFENVKKPLLTLKKIDADSGAVIPKTILTVKALDGTYQDDWTTGPDGTVSLRVDPGVFEVTEKSVPSPYYLPDKDADRTQTITLSPGDEKVLVFRNRKAPKLTVFKENSITHDAIEHAKFKVVYTSNGEAAEAPATIDFGELYTDAKGEIRLHEQGKRLYPGEYTITELEPADGFQLKEPLTQTVILHGNESKTVYFQNTPLSALVVWKYDSVTGAPVEGAIFQVKYMSGTSGSGGTVIGTYKTGPGGSFTINRLEAGAYLVEELASDGDHVMDTAPQTAYISGKEQDVVQLYFGNSPKGAILIKKIDSVTHEPLSDCEFFITDSHGTMLGDANGKFVTDSAGTILISNIDPGTTIVARETRAKNENYLLDDVPQTATIRAGQTVSLEFRNRPKGSVTLYKFSNADRKTPLEGVGFKITFADGKVVDNIGGKLSSNGIYYTDSEGQINISGVTGTLIFTEISTIPGYLIDENRKSQTIVVNPDDHQSVYFYNQPIGSILVKKMSSTTKEPLSDVVIRITRTDGSVVGTSNGEFRTDESGFVKVDAEPGSYLVQEVRSKPGFLLDDTPKVVEVKGPGVYNVELYNQPLGSLVIHKYSSADRKTPLAGVQFKVTYGPGCVVDDENGKLSSNGIYYTAQDGTIRIDGIVGTVVVTEQATIPGYTIDPNTRSQSVVVGPDDTQELYFYNTPKNVFIIEKYLETESGNEPLKGVTFQVTDSSGAVVGNTNGEFVTGDDGRVVISGVESGTTLLVREISVPDGVVLDSAVRSVKIGDDGANILRLYNKKTGYLVVRKLDKISKAPLANVEFELTYSDGSYVDDVYGHLSSKGRFKTNDAGEIRVPVVGTVVVKEITPCPGYVLDEATSRQVVTVNPSDTQTIVVYNEPLCSLKLSKKDAVSGKPVPNTQFTLRDGDGNLIGRYTTGSDGTVTVTGLIPNSTVVVVESKVPSNYVLDPTPHTIIVRNGSGNSVVTGSGSNSGAASGGTSGGTSSGGNGNDLTVENFPKVTLTIEKYLETESGEKPLKGAKFLLTDQTGAVIGSSNGEFISDENGRIVVPNLEPGTTVTVKEISVPDGVVLDTTPKSILIKAGEQGQTLRLVNQETGYLVVQKKDKVSGALLSGAEFELTYASGAYVDDVYGHLSSKGRFKTNDMGEIRVPVVGTVVVKEITPCPGYVLDEATSRQVVTVNPSDTQTIVVYNEPLCSLKLSKKDAVSGKPVPNTQFTLRDGDGNLIGRYTTGSDGTVTVTGLIPNSTVVVVESKVPSNYVLDPTPHTIIVRNGSGNSVVTGSGSGTTSGGASGGTSSSGNGNDLTVENFPKVTLTIEKYLETESGEKPLKGAKFLLTDQTGSVIGNTNGEFISDENGRIVVPNLEPGTTVTVKEISVPDGVVLDTTPKSIFIKAGEQGQTLRLVNQATGYLVIKKLDKLTSQPLAGVEFKLSYTSGEFVDDDFGHLSSLGLYKTDANGEIRVPVVGTVVVEETKCLPGYTIDPGTQRQVVTISPADTQTITVYNTPDTNLTIQKYIEDPDAPGNGDEPLEGVTFLIVDSAGTPLGPNRGEFVTDKNGQIRLSVAPGTTVTAKEIKVPSSEFVLDGTPQSILIKDDVGGQTLTFYNKRVGGLELIKVSASDETKRIPNTTFEIRKMGGALVETVTTDSTGRVHVDLDAGDYYAVETKAGEGFKVDTTPIYFTVEDNKCTTLTVTNKAFSGILIHKVDAITKKGIYGVSFLLYDSTNTPIGQYTSDDQGYVYIEGITTAGRYYLRELENEGYITDTQRKTVYVNPGETTLVEWENTPITGQIQITKKSADYNSTNGLPAGTLLKGAVFEIYDKASNLVDTIRSDGRGLAVSRQLPLGRYTIRETKAPANYGVSDTELTAYLEHEGQIVRFEVTNKSMTTGVAITKTGPAEVMAGQPVRYVFSGIANSSNVRLENFYWRDTLPAEVRLTQITTGTYNFPGTYKITYRVNGGEPQTLADNLSTQKNYTLAASATALGLASNERVTEIMFVFGQVPGGFAQVEKPMLQCLAVSSISSASFVNKADVGGTYQGVWVQAVSRWVTTVYGKKTPTPKLPRTGY